MSWSPVTSIGPAFAALSAATSQHAMPAPEPKHHATSPTASSHHFRCLHVPGHPSPWTSSWVSPSLRRATTPSLSWSTVSPRWLISHRPEPRPTHQRLLGSSSGTSVDSMVFLLTLCLTAIGSSPRVSGESSLPTWTSSPTYQRPFILRPMARPSESTKSWILASNTSLTTFTAPIPASHAPFPQDLSGLAELDLEEGSYCHEHWHVISHASRSSVGCSTLPPLLPP
jgi:hypothetical protein